jgi:hypothetical protein
MRWKIDHPEHDPRHIDLIAAVTLIILIAVTWHFYAGSPAPPTTMAFIVPSQTVHW